MNYTYTVINRNEENTVIYKSIQKFLAIHEYLSIILNELNILKKYKLQNIKNLKSNFNNLYIVQEEDKSAFDLYKKYPVITARIHLNMNDWKLYYKLTDDTEEELIDMTFLIKALLYKIKKNITILVPKVIKSKSKSKLLSQRQQSNLNKTHLIFEEKSYIKSEKSEQTTNLSDNDNLANDNQSDDNIADEIAELKKKRKLMEENLHNSEAKHKKDVDKYSNYCNDLNDKKGELFITKERDEELIRMFESDRGTYIKIQNDFDAERLEKVPQLFADKYPVFKQMDDEDCMYNDDSYEYYKKLYKSINTNKSINTACAGSRLWKSRHTNKSKQDSNHIKKQKDNNMFDSLSHNDLKNKYNIVDDFPDDDFNVLNDVDNSLNK